MNLKIEFARKMSLAYTAVCRPLCQEMKLPQTAFDILMFLYNNPEYKTARDIVEIRNIKANLVSVNVEKLVQDNVSSHKQQGGDVGLHATVSQCVKFYGCFHVYSLFF